MYYLGYIISRWCFCIWQGSLHSLKVFGRENLPKRGPFICVANHASLGDPTVLGAACHTQPLHFMAKKDLFLNKRWGWWFKWTNCIPISRDKKDYRATKEALKKLKEGRCLAVFPEGTRSESGELKEPELGVGFLAIKSNAPVIPIFISGTKKALPINGPYRIGVPVRVYVGEPVDLRESDKIKERREKYRFASDKIMEAIANLKRIANSV